MLFTFPSLSVSQKYLALPDGPGRFTQDFTCPVLLRIPLESYLVTCTGLSPSMVQLSRSFHLKILFMLWSYNLPIAETIGIWAVPRSIATTRGITIVFFSSRYLDVSVLWVSDAEASSWLHHDGLPHSEIYGYNGYLHLPVAYRSLSRPSSPLRAKAFTIRP